MSKQELTTVEETKVAKKELTEAQANKLVQTITNKYAKIDKSFLGIMGDIAKAYDNGVHTYFGYTSFYDMASDMWGIGKTSVKNMVAINRRFGENYKISSEWQEFGTSKLLIIKGLTDEEIEELEITADMSREDISDKVKAYLAIGMNDEDDTDNTDGEESDDTDNTTGDNTDTEDEETIDSIDVATLKDIATFAEEYAQEYKIALDNDFWRAIRILKGMA